jgi:hypothetical protein
MEFVKGNAQTVQSVIDDYLINIEGKTLCRSKKMSSTYFPKYNNMATQIYIHICFTGDTWHRIFRITDKESAQSLATISQGEINLEATMSDAAIAAVELFQKNGYKAVRAVLIGFGNLLSDAIDEFATKFDRTYNEHDLELKVRHNTLEILQDIDWIEDLMEAAGMQPR